MQMHASAWGACCPAVSVSGMSVMGKCSFPSEPSPQSIVSVTVPPGATYYYWDANSGGGYIQKIWELR